MTTFIEKVLDFTADRRDNEDTRTIDKYNQSPTCEYRRRSDEEQSTFDCLHPNRDKDSTPIDILRTPEDQNQMTLSEQLQDKKGTEYDSWCRHSD